MTVSMADAPGSRIEKPALGAPSMDLRLLGPALGVWVACWWGPRMSAGACAAVGLVSVGIACALLFAPQSLLQRVDCGLERLRDTPFARHRLRGAKYLWRALGRHAVSRARIVSGGAGASARPPRIDVGRSRWWCVALLAGIAAGAGSCCWQLSIRDSVRPHVGSEAVVSIEFVASDDPRPVRADRPVVEGQPRERFVVEGKLVHIAMPSAQAAAAASSVSGRISEGASGGGPPGTSREGLWTSGRLGATRIVVFGAGKQWRNILPGQRVRVSARLVTARERGFVAAIALTEKNPVLVGHPPWYQTVAGGIRHDLSAAASVVPEPAGALIPALSIGDTSRMDPSVVEQFRNAGLSHLTAVSGANLAIALAVVLFVVRWCRVPPGATAVVAAVVLIGFVILARPSPSVLRAAVMCGVGLLALAAGRARVALPALAVAIFTLLIYDPALARSPGFGLSVCATWGLIVIAPRWRNILCASGVPRAVSDACAATAAAQLACTPLLIGLDNGLSLVSIPANLAAGIAVPAITIGGIFAAILAPLWSFGAQVVCWIAGWPARWLVVVADACASVPHSTIPLPNGVLGAAAALAVIGAMWMVMRSPTARIVAAISAVIAAAVLIPMLWLTPSAWTGWRVVACDVGQGDGLALWAGEAAAVVVDAGPEPDSIDACLRHLDVTHVPLLILSHLHADHIGGIAGVLHGRRVDRIVGAPGQDPVVQSRMRALAASNHIPFDVADSQWAAQIGELHLESLATAGHKPFTGTRSDPNNNSMVLRARLPGTDGATALLTGDIEVEAQQALIADGAPLAADILKVPHHGSAFFDPSFLAAIDPRVALISVGAHNDYGHPSVTVLTQLRKLGAQILRTDHNGHCAAAASNGRLLFVTEKSSS